MSEQGQQHPTANRMLGSQLVGKSIIRSPTAATPNGVKQQAPTGKQQANSATRTKPNDIDNKSPAAKPVQQPAETPANSPSNKHHEHANQTQIPMSKKSSELKQTKIIAAINESVDQEQQVVAAAAVAAAASSSAKELQLLAKEAQDLKTKSRKLQLEIDEKNEIINVLKDELETLREQNDKYHRDSIQLIKDSKRVKFLQDENDFLQDKVGQVEILELEIKRLKERLNETEFFKLRVGELEEDLAKTQDESNQFEHKLQQVEGKLVRVAELELELNKWKSFSHELESEKNTIQSKLLESIDHETKLSSDNKKVEDEVRRLRDLIKSIEEQRDEEQASNSLIMTVADLKLLDDEEQQQRQQVSKVPTMEIATSTTELFALREAGQQTDYSDTAEKCCETDRVEVAIRPDSHLQPDDDEQLRTLNNENETLKSEVKRQETRLSELAESNKRIFDELDGNRRLILDLRQDLACEKSLTQKLTTQLTSFTKQIKSLDKQYFPMHDATTKKQSNRAELADSKEQSDKLTADETSSELQIKAPTTGHDTKSDVVLMIGSSDNHADNSKQKMLSDQRDACNRKDVSVQQGVKLTLNNNYVTSRLDSNDRDKADETELSSATNKLKRSPTPVKLDRPERDNKSSNFVRNSLPSRSVNFGHSKSSPYLEKIRASVTATAVTSSSNTSAASFNEQTTIAPPYNQQVIVDGTRQQPAGYVLNCMLNHNHTDRCHAKVARPTRVQVSQPALPAIHANPHVHPDLVHQNHHQAQAHPSGVSPSRQLNALIDPVPNNQFLMSALHQQMVAQQQSGLPVAQQLSEQQIAHLTNLQRQHYYHHLHQLHQMHHLHQLHHLHHKCQQQQLQRNNHPPRQHKLDPGVIPVEPRGVGSQFYAPSYDAVYANMATKASNTQPGEEIQIQGQNGTRLVNIDSDLNANGQRQQDYKRINTQRAAPVNAGYHHQMASTKLAQIDELTNNLSPNFDQHESFKRSDAQANKQHYLQSRRSLDARARHQSKYALDAGSASSQHLESHNSPALSSPTSSRTSSNTSPSSDSSSSASSANSLSTSVPLTRSALRHTATDLSRRQYSVERELINSTPLTATLSRVGSCRGTPTRHHLGGGSREASTSRDVNSLMRNPVQSQQPPMRTSKILNIGSQQQQANSGVTSNGSTEGIQSGAEREARKSANTFVDNGFSRPSNLASSRLSNNLAYSSLRIPKKSSSGSNLNTSLNLPTATNGRSTSARDSSASSSPDKSRAMKTASSSSPVGRPAICGTGAVNNNSSVWYEYGCI